MKKYLFAQEISKFCQLFDVSFSTKHRGFICFALLFSNPVLAQFNETIRTGRPGQAIGAFTVGKGVLQVQSGFEVFGSQNSRTKLKSNGFLNNTVVRYGLTETFEVSTLVEYKTETNEQNDIRTNLQGLSAFDVGMRYHIFTGKGLIPNVGFQFRTRLPVLGEDYKVKEIAPRFIVVTSQQLTKGLKLIGNWGAAWNGNDSSPTGTYVTNLSFPFTDKIGAFFEIYGEFQHQNIKANFDAGFAWLLNPNLQLDIYSGYGENKGVRDYFLSMGVSWRTKKE